MIPYLLNIISDIYFFLKIKYNKHNLLIKILFKVNNKLIRSTSPLKTKNIQNIIKNINYLFIYFIKLISNKFYNGIEVSRTPKSIIPEQLAIALTYQCKLFLK